MPLDPQVRDFLTQAAAENPLPMNLLSPQEARLQMLAKLSILGKPQSVARVEDFRFEGPGGEVGVRVYTPAGKADAGPLPILAYFHGGGWVIGDIESHDGLCRALANVTGALVASVDYRLAPEERFPAAVDDAFAAIRWLNQEAPQFGGDPARMSVGGDSAGGNVATVAALMSRERGGPELFWQLLIYPATDGELDTGSYREFAEGFTLSRAEMDWFWDHYMGEDGDRTHPHASPLRAETLSGLPCAFVLTAEYDVLRDEGERYAKRLADAGVPTTLKRYDGMIHGFLRRFEIFDQGRTALQDIAREFRRALEV